MDSRDSPGCGQRSTALEPLEDRVVMSATPIAGSLSESTVLTAADLLERGGLSTDVPLLAHALQASADFWIDASVERDLYNLLGDVEQTLASAHNVTGLAQARNAFGFIGTGQTVAVIDSGIAWDHIALGGGFGPNYRVVGGWDFSEENDANPYDDGPAGSHGTHVAGIVGASAPGLQDTGVAPGVDLVALRVFNDAGAGYFSWVESALRWVHTNRNAFANPITAVNLSLGTAWNANTVPSWSTLEDELAQLKADGIFISVSAGNSFATYNAAGLSYPAASPSVVPVMSVDDSGQLSSFSQRHTRGIAAPGRYIMSTVPDYVGNHNNRPDDYASFSGTSMAAPYVAGASVLVREAMQFAGYANITQDTIYNHLMATADNVFDAATGQTYKRLNLNVALSAFVPADEFGSTVATAHNVGSLIGSGTATVSGLINRLDDVDFFRFTATTSGSITLTTTSNDGGAKWVTTALDSFAENAGALTFDAVADRTYTIGLAAAAKVAHYTLNVHYSLASEAPIPTTPADKAAALDQQLGLTFSRTYSTNWGGRGEKWMLGNGNRWYFITPDGTLFEWSGTRDLAGSRQIAQLDPSFHADPRLLHEASSPPLALPQLAHQLDAQLGLVFTGNYATNWGGMGEKWMRGTNGTWYFIVPSGQLYRWDGSANLSTSTLVATLDPSYHANPALVHNASSADGQASSVVQAQSAVRLSKSLLAESVGIRGFHVDVAKHTAIKCFARQNNVFGSVPGYRRLAELAFAATEDSGFADLAEVPSARPNINHDNESANERAHMLAEQVYGAAVDRLFEQLGADVAPVE